MNSSKQMKSTIAMLFAVGLVVLIAVLAVFDADVATQVQGQSVRGLGNFMLRTEVDGFIRKVDAVEGQELANGQVIFSLNPQELDAELAATEADLAGTQMQLVSRQMSKKLQQEELDAVKQLVVQGLEPGKELRKAQMDMNLVQNQIIEQEAKLLTLSAQKNKIETRLAKYKISSPLAGRLVKLHKFNIGDVLKAGDVLAEIAPNDGDLNFEAKVQPPDISMVKVGNSARITLTAFNRYEVKPIVGKVTYVSSSSLVDSEGKSFFLARITPDVGYLDAVQKVSPLGVGMSAEISISSGSRSILAFLMSPLIRGANKTFTER